MTTDLRAELQAIYEKHKVLTPQVVLQEAKRKTHPLHSRFEWRDGVAAEHWRKHQAHELISSVRIKYTAKDGREDSVRAFHAIRSEEGHIYKPAEEVAEDPLLREILLRDMEREWRQMQSRYSHFAEFLEMVKATLEVA